MPNLQNATDLRETKKSSQGEISPLARARRIVIKIGSALLVDAEKSEVRLNWLKAVIADAVACRAKGQEVVIVSSGSVALGRRVLQLPKGILRLEETQAAAACGQVLLAHAYQEALAAHNVPCAQVLLTLSDTEERQPYLNIRATLRSLLGLGVIPVINENDAVANPHRRYGDNDRLSARVAAMVEADCLILLSDIDGLYTADPSVDPNAHFIPQVENLTPEIMAMAGVSRSGFGRGGMITKLEAARISLKAGCAMAITRGNVLHPVAQMLGGGKCTWFLPDVTPKAARKIWIAGHLDTQGALTIDDGAIEALRNGKSLLPAGIKQVEGNFERGDAVRVLSPEGLILGCGLCVYGAEEARRIMGRKSEDFEKLLGYFGRQEMIHRDDLALL